VEEAIESAAGKCAVLQVDDHVHIFGDKLEASDVKKVLTRFALRSSVWTLHTVDGLPRNDRGKVDYNVLRTGIIS